MTHLPATAWYGVSITASPHSEAFFYLARIKVRSSHSAEAHYNRGVSPGSNSYEPNTLPLSYSAIFPIEWSD